MKSIATRDEGPMSEITILPDGRVYLFGLTRPMLEVLTSLPMQETQWHEMLKTMIEAEETASAAIVEETIR
jgi:hypothetical protein